MSKKVSGVKFRECGNIGFNISKLYLVGRPVYRKGQGGQGIGTSLAHGSVAEVPHNGLHKVPGRAVTAQVSRPHLGHTHTQGAGEEEEQRRWKRGGYFRH